MTTPDPPAPVAVSIILAVRNGREHLPALAVLLAELEFSDYELVIVNDGSTDGSGEELRRLAAEHRGSQYIELRHNLGVARARNRGVAQARGDYIWFIDCDDRWEPGIVRRLHAEARAADVSLAICGSDLVSAAGHSLRQLERFAEQRLINRDQLLELVLRGRVNGYLWNKLFRRDALGQDPFPALSSQSDLAGFIGLLPQLHSCLVINELLYHHIAQPGSITTSRNPNVQNLVDCGQIMQGVLAALGVDGRSRSARYFMTRIIRYAVCNSALRLSERDPATTTVVRSMRAEITARDVWSVFTIDRRAGVAVATLRYAEYIYRRLLARRWRRLRPRYFAGTSTAEASSSRFAT